MWILLLYDVVPVHIFISVLEHLFILQITGSALLAQIGYRFQSIGLALFGALKQAVDIETKITLGISQLCQSNWLLGWKLMKKSQEHVY